MIALSLLLVLAIPAGPLLFAIPTGRHGYYARLERQPPGSYYYITIATPEECLWACRWDAALTFSCGFGGISAQHPVRVSKVDRLNSGGSLASSPNSTPFVSL